MRSRPFPLFQSWLALILIYEHASASTSSGAMSGASSSYPSTTTTPLDFVGNYFGPDQIASGVYCDGGQFTTSSTYAGCCPGTGGCDIGTYCNAGTWYGAAGDTGACNSGSQCETMTIYESDPPASQSWIYQDCLAGLAANTVYRNIPATSTTQSATTLSSSTSAGPSSTPTSGPSVTSSPSATSSPTGSPTGASTQNNTTKSSSKAWIAGAVIGPIVFVVAVGALGFWLRRRMEKPTATSDLRHLSGQVGYVRSMPPSLPNNNKQIA